MHVAQKTEMGGGESKIMSLILDFLPLKAKDRSWFVLAQNFRKTQWTEEGKKNVYHLKKIKQKTKTTTTTKKTAYCCSSVWTNNRTKARNEWLGNRQRLSKQG